MSLFRKNKNNDEFANACSVYEFSAIIDDATCDQCKEYNGIVISQSTYKQTEKIPPLHKGCRCLWVGIYDDDSFMPEINRELL